MARERFELFREGEGRYFMKADDRQLTFVRDASGQVSRIDLVVRGNAVVLERAP